MTVVSIDPGDTCGIAVWSNEGVLKGNWKLSLEELIDYLDNELSMADIAVVVCEDFTLRGQRGRLNAKGNKLKASQGIGVAKAFAKRMGAKFVAQQPAILKIAALHTRTKIVTHFADDVSAYLHGYWFFEQQGILHPVADEG